MSEVINKVTLFPEIISEFVCLLKGVTRSKHFAKSGVDNSVGKSLTEYFRAHVVEPTRIINQNGLFHDSVAHHSIEKVTSRHTLVNSELGILE